MLHDEIAEKRSGYSFKRPGRLQLSFLEILMKLQAFITAHKRSLRRLCFHKCLSVHREGVCLWSGGCVFHTPPRTDTPPGQTPPPPGQTPHCPVHAGIHIPCPVNAGIRSTSGRYASHWNAFLFFTANVQTLRPERCFQTSLKS